MITSLYSAQEKNKKSQKFINIKLSKGIGVLSKLRHYVPKSTLKSVYYSFIYPFVNYNLLNWSSSPYGNKECIRISMRKAIRIMSFEHKQAHSAPIFKSQEVLPLDEVIKLKQASLIWQLEHNHLPVNIANTFLKKTVDSITRQAGNYRLPNPRLDYTKRHITYSGIKLWNTEIPNSMKELKNLKTFRKHFHKHLLMSL